MSKMSGFSWMALAGALAVSGCGGSEQDWAAPEAEEAMGVAQQALSCGYCPENMWPLRGQPNAELTCYCRNSVTTTSGSVWGTDIYTDDSKLCRAALHAGAIPSSGGYIKATWLPGQSNYVGSIRNGVTSFSYGTYNGSFSVTSAPTCTLTMTNCPVSLTAYELHDGQEVSCNCSSTAISTSNFGSVWGTGTYTDDSSLCYAAIHAGVITTSGGTVTAVISPGASSYVGSTQNGVTSNSTGSFRRSMYFP